MRGEDVQVLSAGTVANPYSGADERTWEVPPTERTVTTIAPPEPRPSGEPMPDTRNAVTDGWTLYLPPGDPVTVYDRVRVRGQVFNVEGTPADWSRGVVVQATRTKG